MQIPIDQEFLTICEEILKEDLTVEQWREIESDDMFQTPHYQGGFEEGDDGDGAFCFSYYDPNGSELWFQLTLSEVGDAIAGKLKFVDARPAGT